MVSLPVPLWPRPSSRGERFCASRPQQISDVSVHSRWSVFCTVLRFKFLYPTHRVHVGQPRGVRAAGETRGVHFPLIHRGGLRTPGLLASAFLRKSLERSQTRTDSWGPVLKRLCASTGPQVRPEFTQPTPGALRNPHSPGHRAVPRASAVYAWAKPRHIHFLMINSPESLPTREHGVRSQPRGSPLSSWWWTPGCLAAPAGAQGRDPGRYHPRAIGMSSISEVFCIPTPGAAVCSCGKIRGKVRGKDTRENPIDVFDSVTHYAVTWRVL